MLFKVASYRVPAPERDQFVEALSELIAASKEEPGVKGYRGGFDLHDSDVFTITGIYDDDDAFDAHLQSPHWQKAAKTVSQLVNNRGVQFMSAGSIPFTEEEHNTEHHGREVLASWEEKQ